ncbi:hypothetical protein HPB49_008575 [Dermacentor silvarum]|uniref:Uncharacterized protein n=1 Tax=Dermacentor silvarum TaxID=543639 RepID=A0ACB8DNK6_DERSI|nr:hypothetical protein HPB49_008575 [Dermacentor silvarum]
MIAKGSPLLVVGDFNAHHPAWGYRFAQVKGKDLWNSIQQNGLTLLTDPLRPTRQGNSVSQDTTPDLTLVGGRISATWCNTGENLGSDHRIIEIVIEDGPSVARTKKLETVNWHAFRESRSGQDGIEDIDEWSRGVIQSVQDATEEIEVDENQERVDRHMINLWRKKHELNLRLEQKRGDRNLRRQLAALNKEIEEYALTLTKQNWSSICEQMDHKIGSARTWHLLRHLLDPDKSKLEARQQLQKLVYKYEGTTDELIAEGLRGNEKAHALARGLTFRDSSAVSTTPPSEEPLQTADDLSTFQEILNHFLGRERQRSHSSNNNPTAALYATSGDATEALIRNAAFLVTPADKLSRASKLEGDQSAVGSSFPEPRGDERSPVLRIRRPEFFETKEDARDGDQGDPC